MTRYRLKYSPEMAIYVLQFPDGSERAITPDKINAAAAQNDAIRELANLAYMTPGAWAELAYIGPTGGAR